MNFEQKKQLAEDLTECYVIKNDKIRKIIINNLPEAISKSCERCGSLFFDVLMIVERCLDYSDGIEKLLMIVGSLEKNSDPMQKVCETILRIWISDEPAISYKKTAQLLAILLQKQIHEDKLTDCYLESLFDDFNPISQKGSLFSIVIHLTSIPKLHGIWPILIFAQRFYEKNDDKQVKILLKNWTDSINHKEDIKNFNSVRSQYPVKYKYNGCIGIDFGPTYSVIAIYDERKKQPCSC
ncbi:MAG: hypothetical protein GY749_48980 [Desulfobacteraceae bacterium]|nr:hypothetical protein [Desulfobacteraceae bacterium]